MKSNIIKPKNETEEMLLAPFSLLKTFVKRLLNKPIPNLKKTLEYKITKARETFPFNPPIPIDVSWMVGLTSLEVYNYFLSI